MLPGIRFLFIAVVFAVSLVIFGLGAAALLRSAHEEFASLPTRYVAPPTVFAQQPAETQPTLSMLRVETLAPEIITPPAVASAPASEETTVIATPAGPEKAATPETVAALTTTAVSSSETPAPIETAKPDIAKVEAPEPVTTVAVAPTTSVETPAVPAPEVVIVAPVQAQQIETPPAPQPTATLTDDDTKLSSTRIATLGGPPVDTEPVPLPVAKPAIAPVKKVVKKPTAKKRRVAAPPVAVAAQPADPFGQQPFGR